MIESLPAGTSADRLLPAPVVAGAPTRSLLRGVLACLFGLALVIGGAASGYAWAAAPAHPRQATRYL